MRDLSESEKQGWIEYMRQCVGLVETSALPPKPAAPRITIANRAHKAGRSIVTAAEVVDELKARDVPATQNVKVTYMGGKSFPDQVMHF